MRTGKPLALKQNLSLLAVTSCLLFLMFVRLYFSLQPNLEQTQNDYLKGRTINLDKKLDQNALIKILAKGNYYDDAADLKLVTDSLPQKLQQSPEPDNLGALNKKEFAITAPIAWQAATGGVEFQSRVRASRIRLGFDSALYVRELSNAPILPSTADIGNGRLKISGEVNDTDNNGYAHVLVQLKHHLSSAMDDFADEVYYARTDGEGKFSFSGLKPDSAYSVVPLKPGFEFGARKGTADLESSKSYSFRARPHLIRLFGTVTYSRLKEDRVFTVRTPQQFRQVYFIVVVLFFLAFWAIHFFWKLRRFVPDKFLLPLLMMLTGISILVLFGLQDPLQDTLYAPQTLQGLIAGLILLAIFSQIQVGKIYTRWWFDWIYNYRKRLTYNLQGWTWLSLSILLCLMTIIFGSGPEGSGVKVNLQLGSLLFQPSEVTKYLLLIFFAAFFAANEEKIRNFSDIRWRFLTSWGVMVGTLVVLALYLLLGDMGPAMVVCFTFLVFYAIARGNLLMTIATGIVYGFLLWLLPGWLATLLAFVMAAGILIFQKQVRSAKWYGWAAVLTEAPVILLMIIAAFSFGDKIPGVGDRLSDRKNMWLNKWNNDVYGGDHLAHSYWTLSSGGFSGQGLGRGNANTMPAAHTDMILPAVGEQLGWLGLVSVFLIFGVLIHRVFLQARRAGQPFSFYLCAGIAIATAVQFLLIACGSIGLLPLTGVAVPFLSYGKISLIINLAAMGIIAGISARPGKEIQKEYIQRFYDPVLIAGISGVMAGIVLLSIQLMAIQWWSAKNYIVKAARVINRNGLPVYSYNPRIEKLTRLLGAGTIYDRKNLVLATSSTDTLRNNLAALQQTGLDFSGTSDLIGKRQLRYYPFGEQMFFWVGDFNTRLFWGQGNGYFAEAANLSSLRGFNTQPASANFITTKFRADRFSKPVERQVSLLSYDYSELAPMLLAGIDSSRQEIRSFKAKNRDLQLTVDAALQVELQNAIGRSEFRDKRISVVVLDAASGDILASALHPLPNLSATEEMLLTEKEQAKLKQPITARDLGMTYATAPGSTAKILTAIAALNKMGNAASKITYNDFKKEETFRPDEPCCNTLVDMRDAIVYSSNVYFLRIANENNLDNEMANLYLATGMGIDFEGAYNYSKGFNTEYKQRILNQWRDSSLLGIKHIYRRGKKSETEFSFLAWGQGRLTATPVAMARMAGLIANDGILEPTRIVKQINGKNAPQESEPLKATNAENARLLTTYMIAQSNENGRQKISGLRVAGKTGTPERGKKPNEWYDGWYVFFAPTPNKRSHTVVCIRIENKAHASNINSGSAVRLANVVAPILKKMNYLISF